MSFYVMKIKTKKKPVYIFMFLWRQVHTKNRSGICITHLEKSQREVDIQNMHT